MANCEWCGRYFPDGKVLVQTYNPLREPILYACTGQIEKFYAGELETRKILGFPPFSRLIRLVFRSANQLQAESFARDASNILQKTLKNKADIIGPAECPILKISQNYRYQIILRSGNINILQQAVSDLMYNYTHPQSVYIEFDIDPVSLL